MSAGQGGGEPSRAAQLGLLASAHGPHTMGQGAPEWVVTREAAPSLCLRTTPCG